mmetsp:Transcript_14460/g.31005  ORF Transcript_14460/g.31005 Transcript_14460/m.31005 type:complete len:323 (+) Transcript_14460:322-1290(+)|eukprot:2899473-Pleurochrysis_carterae.AAC.3
MGHDPAMPPEQPAVTVHAFPVSEGKQKSDPEACGGTEQGVSALLDSAKAYFVLFSQSLAEERESLTETSAMLAKLFARTADKEMLCSAALDAGNELSAHAVQLHDALEASLAARVYDATLAQQTHAAKDSLERQLAACNQSLQTCEQELAAERARRKAAEGSSASCQAQAKAQQAVASGVVLKLQMLEKQAAESGSAVAAERRRADAAEARAAQAEAALRKASEALSSLREEAASTAARARGLEASMQETNKQQQSELLRTQRLCVDAKEECARVRRRNEQLERELASFRARCGIESSGGAKVDIGEVMGNLEQMESLMAKR